MEEKRLQIRKTNIELCRIFSILLVILVHSNFAWTGYPKTGDGIARFLIQGFSIIGVNVFVLITGYFSTSIKIKNIVNLFYICVFYGIIKLFADIVFRSLNIKDLFFISKSNWFIISYLGLLFFTGFLNKLESKKDFFRFCIPFSIYEVYFSFFPAIVDLDPGFNHGYSILSFILIYVIGRYIRLFGFPNRFKKWSSLFYISLSLMVGIIAFLIFTYGTKIGLKENFYIRVFDYNNPLVVLSSICFFTMFEKLNIKNNGFINHIAKSVLAVLLVHGSSSLNMYMKLYFKKILNINIVMGGE